MAKCVSKLAKTFPREVRGQIAEVKTSMRGDSGSTGGQRSEVRGENQYTRRLGFTSAIWPLTSAMLLTSAILLSSAMAARISPSLQTPFGAGLRSSTFLSREGYDPAERCRR